MKYFTKSKLKRERMFFTFKRYGAIIKLLRVYLTKKWKGIIMWNKQKIAERMIYI